MKKFVMSCFALCAFAAFAFESAPLLVADYDRDGKIGDTDRIKAYTGEKFTIWINDDDDDHGDGDTNTDLHDVPGGNEHKDCEDDEVNGRCDLLDFFPVLVDMNGVDRPDDYTWKLISKSVNVVFTRLKADTAGDFHTKEEKALDDETPLYRAEVTNLTEGVALPNGFLVNGRGVFLIEGAALADGGITLRGTKEGGDPVEVTMRLDVVNVEDMYGWMNLRPEAAVSSKPPYQPPAISQPSQPSQRHFILVHGYNTNPDEARGNAAEFYKKLYQSGTDAMFTAVEWRGDQSQVEIPLVGLKVTPNYFVNVENAFLAARPFADACKKLPGEKILVGHSLGNVLVSSAIKDYGLDYTKFVMLNAAVAREAFDASVYDKDMVDEDWLGKEMEVEGEGWDAPTNHLDWGSRWYRNFADKKYDPYEYRRKLAWRGRFANLPRTINYYSPTDNVLLNPDPSEPDPDEYDEGRVYNAYLEKLSGTANQKTGFGFWAFSEKMKGTWVVDAINSFLEEADAMKCEAGWGVNTNYVKGIGFSPTNTHFTPFLDPRMKTIGMLDILPAETERLRAQHLADAIPAESFAAGANPVATLENVNMESFIGENPDWPVYEGDRGEAQTNEWRHSTFREVAFYHTSKLYASLAAVGKPRVIIDTDLGGCKDDLFALDLAARMHKQGKLDLMAVMMNRPDHSDKEKKGEFLSFADRYLASLELGDLQIGTSEPPLSSWTETTEPQKVFNPYWTLIYSNNVTGVGLLMPTNRMDAEIASLTNAVTLYRRLLKGAPDRSVVICSIGFLNNLKALMESAADYEGDGSINSTGLQLIAAKVKELRIMGGSFDPTSSPDGKGGAEYNFAGDPAAARMVMEEWPTPIVCSPWEVGKKLDYEHNWVVADFPAGTFNPVIRAAEEVWPPIKGEDELANCLWDPMTVLPLIEGETLVPTSSNGVITVDEKTGKTTFEPDASGNRCYQVASNMNAKAVMNRLRSIYKTGNPSAAVVPISPAEPGIDYNGSTLVVKIDGFDPGSSYEEKDLFVKLTVNGATYEKTVRTDYDELSGLSTFEFEVPPGTVTAGNAYEGEVKVGFRNDTLGENVVYTRKRQFFVQGRQERAEPMTDWFNEKNLEAPTNYVPETKMPVQCLAKVETTFLFEAPSEATDEPPVESTDWIQGAVRIVEDGAGGYKFQYYACVGKTNEDSFVRGWWDANYAGEGAQEIKPKIGTNYTVRAEADYFDDTHGGENTLIISVMEEGSNQGFVKQFIGNIINRDGGRGGTPRLNSVEFLGDGEIPSLIGNYYTNTVNATLAKIDGDREYATVAEAVAAAMGSPVRLMHAASWKPTEDDIGKPFKFLNKSWLNLDLSGFPLGTQAVWTNVDGNDGTLTIYKPVFADTVVYGAIRTADKENGSVAEAIAIKDGKYVYVGDEAGVAAFIEDGVTEIVDHRGKGMVMPGCTDGHSHYIQKFCLANMKGGVLFAGGDDKTAVLQKLEAAALKAKEAGKKSLLGFGWNYHKIIPAGGPTLKELDDVTYGVSAVIFDSSGHSAYCNSECLKRCKIIDGEGNVLINKIDGGLLELDEKGYPTGYVDERVTGYLTRMGGIDPDEIVDDELAETSIRLSQELLLSTGYTIAFEGWSNVMHPTKFYAAANSMDKNGELKIVFPMTYEVEPWQTDIEDEEIEHLASLKETYGTKHVLPEYLKVFMDGCAETKTGAMSKPYKDGTVYTNFWSVDRLAGITRACNERGLVVHTHVMGDVAITETTDAYVKANTQRGSSDCRNCLVHLRNVNANDFQRFADNNISCTAGLTWHLGGAEKELGEIMDEDYVNHSYPIKSFFDVGAKVSSHSDFPANGECPQDPFGMMHVAVTGQHPNHPELKPYDTNELVTVEQAFQTLTINGAWQMGLENERGSIRVGKWADFVLADQDVFECATTDIGKTKVVSTWFEGEKVYQAPLPGSEGNPWLVGATTNDTVTAWTNGTTLVVRGEGAMCDFTDPAPWAGAAVSEIEIGFGPDKIGITNIGENAFANLAGVTNLIFHCCVPPAFDASAFAGLGVVTVKVPCGSSKAYEEAFAAAGLTDFSVIHPERQWRDCKKIADYLYEIWFDGDYTVDECDSCFNPARGSAVFACSAVRNGGLFGRNLDLPFFDIPNIVTHLAATSTRHGSIGISVPGFMIVTNGADLAVEYAETLNMAPSMVMTGINDVGVVCECNVISIADGEKYIRERLGDSEFSFDPSPKGGSHPGDSEKYPNLNKSAVVQFVLDNAESAADAVRKLNRMNVYGDVAKIDTMHLMIADENRTFSVEFIGKYTFVVGFDGDGTAEELKSEIVDEETDWTNVIFVNRGQKSIMTNWWLAFDKDTTTVAFTNDNQHAAGVERYRALDRFYDNGETFTGMRDLMERVKFSNIGELVPGEDEFYPFTDNGEPPRPSWEDFTNDTVVIANNLRTRDSYNDLFTNNIRVGGIWATAHSAVIDMEKRTLDVRVWERWSESFGFCLSPLGSEENPWKIGATTNDTVTAWTNGTTLVVEGRGAMKGFETAGPWGTDIAAVDFGTQVTNFGANAFAGCAALKTLTMRGNPPALGGNNALSGVTKIVIREDALAKFEADPDWNAHAAKFESVPVCYDYEHIKTLTPFLHEVWFDDYTFDAKGETLAGVESFSCSSVRNGNFIGRNFDFFLDDKPEFVVHVAANPEKGRLASVAMAMHTGMREDGVTNGQYTASYDLLPNRTLDGINECGVAINQNVVAYDPEVAAGVEQEFSGTNPGAPDLNSSFVTRMVLDRATNAAHAVELIKSYNIFGISVSGDILHYMISDSKETYVVEIITNTVVARHFTMMTNFAINWDNEHARALTDADNEVWTRDNYPEPSNLVVSAGHFVDATNELAKYYARHAEGVERFVRLRDNYDEGATFEGMEALMRRAQYSQASTFETQPYWYSDRCSVEVDKKLTEAGYPAAANTYMLYGLKYYKDDADPDDLLEGSLDEFLNREVMEYERECLANKDAHRKDDCGVWLTVHNTTYDISNRMFRVVVQEDYDHTFDIYLSDRPVEQPVTPGEPLGPYKTAEKATNVAEKAVLEPSAEVAAVLTTEEVREDYKSKFDFAVAYKSGEESGWYVEAMLTAAGSNDLARSANTVTTNINLAAIAALVGETTTSMTLMGGITGFYYSLYGAAGVRALPEGEMYGPELCGASGEVTFSAVKKPSDAAGFFTVGASAGR